MDTKEIYDYILKIQSISKIGLKFSEDPYAISNYQEINDLSLQFLEKFLEIELNRPNYFQRDIYPTPNISVRTIILSPDKKRVLLVREVKTQNYSIPGGWADLYEAPSEAAKKECLQEAGAEVEIIRLVGLINHTPYKKPNSVPEYVAIFEGRVNGALKEHEYETDQVGWFALDALPAISEKVDIKEFKRMINAVISGETIYD